MAKVELGTKRLCAKCGTKFYDMGKSPIVCPKCATVFEPATKTSSRAVAAPVAAAAVPEPEKEPVEAVDLVSLEDADREQGAAKKVVADVDVDDDFEIDETLSDDDEDDPFLEEDEDENDDVSGLLGGGIDADDEEV